jgi:fatty-acyl-CoA synthase/long-chain acyl-CoA synthetase
MEAPLTFTLNSLFSSAFHIYSKRIALHDYRHAVTYDELRLKANQTAHALINRGITPGSPVSLLMPNSIEYVTSLMGVFFAGGARVAMNTMLNRQDIEYILRDSGTSVALIDRQYADLLADILPALPSLQHVIIARNASPTPDHNFEALGDVNATELTTDPLVDVHPGTPASLSYTGGTTGRPKGVVGSNQGSYFTTLSVILEEDVLQDDRMLLTTPLPHASGLRLMAGLAKGAEIFIKQKFDVKDTINTVAEERITFVHLVPTMIYRLLDHMDDHVDTSTIRTIAYGTSPITSERLGQALDRFGPVFVQSYGATESPGLVTRLTKTDHTLSWENSSERLASCGQPTLFSRIRIVDDDLNDLPLGQPGEVLINSYTNMVKYLGLPDRTAETLVDGWLRTGDVGLIDPDGYLYLLDRKKDMIITGGLNVYSKEVEDVLQRAPGVRTVAVVGLPHSYWGEAVTAFVVPTASRIDIQHIAAYSADHLAGYKRPKSIKLIDEFPLTQYGKIDKKVLRDPYWSSSPRRI